MTSKEAPRDELACENYVICKTDLIQAGCGMIVLSAPDMRILATNKTLSDSYGKPATLSDLLPADDVAQITEDLVTRGQSTARFLTLNKGELVWAGFFKSDTAFGIDLTFMDSSQLGHDQASQAFADCVREMSELHELIMQSDKPDITQYFDVVARGVQRLTGFDRVKIYQFDNDLNGCVVAENRVSDDIPSYLGLKFPSGDIPRPARDLFLMNKVRQVIDVDAMPEPLVSTADGRSQVTVNQERSSVRYSSPIHNDYLRNMGVRSTVVVGITVRRKLWGLISCHNCSEMLQLQPQMLNLCHVISDIASSHIGRLIDFQRTNASADIRAVLTNLTGDTARKTTTRAFLQTLDGYQDRLLGLLDADGISIQSDITQWQGGTVPDVDDMAQIATRAAKWRDDFPGRHVATSDLHRFCPDLSAESADFGGFAEFLTWDKKLTVHVFRKAMVHDENWAGDPDAKTRYADTDHDILHPRNSFEKFATKTSGCSLPWSETHLQVGRELLDGFRTLETAFNKSQLEQSLRKTNAKVKNALFEAEYQSRHDALTDLPNRRGFESYLADLKGRKDAPAAMWFCHIDADHFKTVNDTLGHLAGDQTLRHIASVLSSFQETGGLAARIGGDEFALLVPSDRTHKEMDKLCSDLLAAIANPIFHKGMEITASCSIGLTTFNPKFENISEVLTRSDLALYSGKAQGRGRHIFFSKDMEATALRRRELERQIEIALETDAFIPYFQPQYDTLSGRLVGFEVLARWQHDRVGTLVPRDFMDTAESMGVLKHIDKRMLTQAVTTLEQWRAKHGLDLSLSVNISAERLASRELLTDLRDIGGAAQNINLELLETIYLDDHEIDHKGIVADLRKTGVGIEIDDFGTGHTSILSVLAVQPDRLKIDRRLIDPIVKEKSARDLVRSILQIGTQLGITAVAEGVESEEHRNILCDLNCERLQGYYYGKPKPAAEIEKGLFHVAA